MSNLERLIENSLSLLENHTDYQHWKWAMREDVNWENCDSHISLDDLWDICQYVLYTYVPAKIDEYEAKKDQLNQED